MLGYPFQGKCLIFSTKVAVIRDILKINKIASDWRHLEGKGGFGTSGGRGSVIMGGNLS